MVLGTALAIKTLHGAETLKVPPGTQHAQELRLRGQGAPRLDSERKGDHVLHVQLAVPKPKSSPRPSSSCCARWPSSKAPRVPENESLVDKVKNLFT